jgi:hypothetical protein
LFVTREKYCKKNWQRKGKNPQMYNMLFCFSGSADHGDTYDIGVTGINTYIHAYYEATTMKRVHSTVSRYCMSMYMHHRWELSLISMMSELPISD